MRAVLRDARHLQAITERVSEKAAELSRKRKGEEGAGHDKGGVIKRARNGDDSELTVDSLASAFNRNKASMGAPATRELESMRNHFLGVAAGGTTSE